MEKLLFVVAAPQKNRPRFRPFFFFVCAQMLAVARFWRRVSFCSTEIGSNIIGSAGMVEYIVEDCAVKWIGSVAL